MCRLLLLTLYFINLQKQALSKSFISSSPRELSKPSDNLARIAASLSHIFVSSINSVVSFSYSCLLPSTLSVPSPGAYRITFGLPCFKRWLHDILRIEIAPDILCCPELRMFIICHYCIIILQVIHENDICLFCKRTLFRQRACIIDTVKQTASDSSMCKPI